MPRTTCPECDEVVTLPSSKRSLACPACGTKIRAGSTDDEPEDEAQEEEEQDDEEERKPRKRKKKARKLGRDSEKIRGLIPLILFGLPGLVLAILAPFSGYATALSMVIGAFLMVFAAIVIYLIYRKTPGLMEERFRRDADEQLIPAATLLDSIFCAFSRPRLLGAWVTLQYLGLLMVTMGIIGMTVFKRLEEGLGANPPGQNQPQQPPPQPPQQPQQPKEDDETVINKAIAAIDKNENDWVAFSKLTDVKPNQRRAEVVRKMATLTTNGQDGITRVKAAELLALWATPDDLETLHGLLAHKELGVRLAILAGVRRLHDLRSIPVLVTYFVEWRDARTALIEFGPAAEPALLPYLTPQTDRSQLEPALAIINKIGTEKSVPQLEVLAKLDDPFRVNPAKEALMAINERLKNPPPPK